MIGRYVTSDVLRLGLSGLAAGSAVGLVWRLAGRTRCGVVSFPLAVLVAAVSVGRSDWFRWDGVAAFGVSVTLLAGIGAARLLANPAVGWVWVAIGSFVSAVGVWAGVPETGPAVLVGGVVVGLTVMTAVTGSSWAPAAGMGVAAGLGWAGLSGAAGRPWAAVGGVLCTGMTPWLALALGPLTSRREAPRLWVLGVHIAVVILAARWIGVVPHAGWHRVAVVAGIGLAASTTAGRRA